MAWFYSATTAALTAFTGLVSLRRVYPASARNFYLTGAALVKLRRDESSLRWLQRAVELDPTHAEARFQLGHVLRRLGRMEEARAQLEAFKALKARAAAAPGRP